MEPPDELSVSLINRPFPARADRRATEWRGRLVDTYSREGACLGSQLLSDDLTGNKMTVLRNEEITVLDNSLVPTVVFYVEGEDLAPLRSRQ